MEGHHAPTTGTTMISSMRTRRRCRRRPDCSSSGGSRRCRPSSPVAVLPVTLSVLYLAAMASVIAAHNGSGGIDPGSVPSETVVCDMYEVSSLLPPPEGDDEPEQPDGGGGGAVLLNVEDGWRCVVRTQSPYLADGDYAREVAYDVRDLPSYAVDLLTTGGGGGGGTPQPRGDNTLEIRGALLDSTRYELTLTPEAEFRLVNNNEGLFHPARRKGNLRTAPRNGGGGAAGRGGAGAEAAGGGDQQSALGAQEREPRRNGALKGALKKSGVSTVLLLRVCDSTGSCPPFTAAEASNAVFGTDGDEANLVSQYDLCSAHKLKFVPATGQGIVDGVLDVTLKESVQGKTRTAAENLAADAAVDLLFTLQGAPRRSLDRHATHAILALPPGTSGSWNAEGYYNWYRTVFNHDKVLHLSYQMHEIAHNLDLRHSGQGSSMYGDTSGYQGYTYATDDTPLMCFNAAKSWESGWYEDRHVTVDVLGGNGAAAAVQLIGVVDYEADRASGDQAVVIRIPDRRRGHGAPAAAGISGGGGNLADLYDDSEKGLGLYVMFNRAKSFNSQTKEHADDVTIVRAGPPDSSVASAPGIEGGAFNTHVTSYNVGALSLKSSKKKARNRVNNGGLKAGSAAGSTTVYREENFDGPADDRGGGGHALIIELCEMTVAQSKSSNKPDIATVVIRLEGVHDLSCADALGNNDPGAAQDDAGGGNVLSQGANREGGRGKEKKARKKRNKEQQQNNDALVVTENNVDNGLVAAPCEDVREARPTLRGKTLTCNDLATHVLELQMRAGHNFTPEAVAERRIRRFRRSWCVSGTAAESCRDFCGPWIAECRNDGPGDGKAEQLLATRGHGEAGATAASGAGHTTSAAATSASRCEDASPDAVATLVTPGGTSSALVINGDETALLSEVEAPPVVVRRKCAELWSLYGEGGRAATFQGRWCSSPRNEDGYGSDASSTCGGFCRNFIPECADVR